MKESNYPSLDDTRNRDELALRAMARPKQHPAKCRCGAPIDTEALEHGIVRYYCNCEQDA